MGIPAVISTLQRGFDGKYLSRVEVLSHYVNKYHEQITEVVFVSEALADLEESRQQAREYCRENGLQEVTLVEEIEKLPERVYEYSSD